VSDTTIRRNMGLIQTFKDIEKKETEKKENKNQSKE